MRTLIHKANAQYLRQKMTIIGMFSFVLAAQSTTMYLYCNICDVCSFSMCTDVSRVRSHKFTFRSGETEYRRTKTAVDTNQRWHRLSGSSKLANS